MLPECGTHISVAYARFMELAQVFLSTKSRPRELRLSNGCLGCQLCRLYEVYWLESPRDLESCLGVLWLHIQKAAWKGRDIREQHDICEFLDALIARLYADSTEKSRAYVLIDPQTCQKLTSLKRS